jgi:DNA-binding response OmpR family regulator
MHRCIVVIDDEPEVLSLLRDILELADYQVIPVAHPGDVQSTIRDASPDLFLIDIMLPGMSGIELAQQLRTSGYAATPMIAMSASRLMATYASGSGVFEDTITKPFEVDALLARAQRSLEARHNH